jgi:GTP cyclohydrolase I
MNQDRIAEAVRMFLEAVEEPLSAEDTERTPARVARAWAEELLSGYAQDPSALLTWSKAESEGLVHVGNIRFASTCIHHLLPFSGFAHVVYRPHHRLVGLSKIGRLVEAHARRLQVQERLTRQIVDTFQTTLEPHGVLVVLEAEHTCMTLRGSRKEGSRMTTVEGSGIFASPGVERTEALELIHTARRGR